MTRDAFIRDWLVRALDIDEGVEFFFEMGEAEGWEGEQVMTS